jgi:hypothetical protein
MLKVEFSFCEFLIHKLIRRMRGMKISTLGECTEISKHLMSKRLVKLSVIGEYSEFTGVGLPSRTHLQIRLMKLSVRKLCRMKLNAFGECSMTLSAVEKTANYIKLRIFRRNFAPTKKF